LFPLISRQNFFIALNFNKLSNFGLLPHNNGISKPSKSRKVNGPLSNGPSSAAAILAWFFEKAEAKQPVPRVKTKVSSTGIGCHFD